MSSFRALLVLGLATLSGVAQANGRYPATMSVHYRPGDDQVIAVGATIGLLQSHDDGETWTWTCEGSIGYGGPWDPVYQIAADGTLYATTTHGLRVSRDGGCTWTTVGDPLGDQWISDVQIGPDGAVWATTANSGLDNDVYVSRDGGQTFEPAGAHETQIWWKSIRVAPGDPGRVYLSGYLATDPDPLPVIRRLEASGQWTDLPFSYMNQSTVLLLDVSPGDPDLLFARVNGPLGDALVRSVDGAMSWDPVLVLDGAGNNLMAFTPLDATGLKWLAGTVNNGVRVSDDGGETWTDAATSPKMTCAGRRPEDGALHACGANWTPDRFALAESTDDGQHWTKLVRFSELDGELDCPAGSGHATLCASLWPGIVNQFGIGEQDAGPDEGIDAGPMPPKNGSSGCGGCQVGLAALLVVWPWRRRRR
jgi:hypothetical protein